MEDVVEPVERTRRGTVLIFALGILSLLSLFALSFVKMTNLERNASANHVLQVRVRMLTEAGLAVATAKIQESASQRGWVNPKEDWWAVGLAYQAKLNDNAYGGSDFYEIHSYELSGRLSIKLTSPGMLKAPKTGTKGPLELLGLTKTEADDLVALLVPGSMPSSTRALRLAVGAATFKKIRDYVTVHGWQRPTADHSSDTTRFTKALPWDYQFPAKAQPPVNINAASETVLVAVLANLRGQPIQVEGKTASPEWLAASLKGDRGEANAKGTEIEISETLAGTIAKEIVACRESTNSTGSYKSKDFGGVFKSWFQFEAFLGDLVGSGKITAKQQGLVLALCDPNSRPMGYNPDRPRRRGDPDNMFDKATLKNWTAELCLVPSGIVEIRSHGWITTKDEHTIYEDDGSGTLVGVTKPIVVAEDWLSQVVRVFTPVQYTSQKNLEALWKDPDREVFQSYPEAYPRSDIGSVSQVADEVAGAIQLTTEEAAVPAKVLAGFGTAFRPWATWINSSTPLIAPESPFTFSQSKLKLRRKGSFGPDGMIVWRSAWGSAGLTLSKSNPPESLIQEGSLEFWIKLASTVGTDEVLMALNIDETNKWGAEKSAATAALNSNGGNPYSFPSKYGATIKVERFKGQLRATWFYWGVGAGGLSRYKLVLAEMGGSISGWKAGEWHHVAVSWKHTKQDWSKVTSASTSVGNAGSDGIKLYTDGSLNSSEIVYTYASVEHVPKSSGGPYLNGQEPRDSVKFHLGQIASIPNSFGVYVGGVQVGGGGGKVHNTGTPPAGGLDRYPNATLDDVFIYPKEGDRSLLNSKDRYPKGGSNKFTLELPVPPSYYTIGSVAVSVEIPDKTEVEFSIKGYSGIKRKIKLKKPQPPKKMGQEHWPVITRDDINKQSTWKGSTSPWEPDPAKKMKSFEDYVVGGKLPIEIQLKSTDGDKTPTLEDVTMILLHPTEVLERDEDAYLDEE